MIQRAHANVPDEIARAYLLERFDDFLSLEAGSSRNTREAYGRDVARFATFARGKGAQAPQGVL
ncbi:MAG: site-specific integrase, partial [Gemmatimonadota bacterium]